MCILQPGSKIVTTTTSEPPLNAPTVSEEPSTTAAALGTTVAGGQPSGTTVAGGLPSSTTVAGGLPSSTTVAGGQPSGTTAASTPFATEVFSTPGPCYECYCGPDMDPVTKLHNMTCRAIVCDKNCSKVRSFTEHINTHFLYSYTQALLLGQISGQHFILSGHIICNNCTVNAVFKQS